MISVRRISNILRYGLGEGARKRKQRARSSQRLARFESGLWRRELDLVTRSYESYDDYLNHQAAKLQKIESRLRETEEQDYREFLRRFENCDGMRQARTVLCLGARLGAEVRALLSLGYFAVGLDLNPGAGNPYVLTGDFHDTVFPDRSVDAVYCNALDHVFDLDRTLAEIHRLLRPGGVFVADLIDGFEEGFIPGAFEATHWARSRPFAEDLARRSGWELLEFRDLGRLRRDHWQQAVFRKFP